MSLNDSELEINPKIKTRKTLSPYGIIVTVFSITFIVFIFMVIFAIIKGILKLRKRRNARSNSGGAPLLPIHKRNYIE